MSAAVSIYQFHLNMIFSSPGAGPVVPQPLRRRTPARAIAYVRSVCQLVSPHHHRPSLRLVANVHTNEHYNFYLLRKEAIVMRPVSDELLPWLFIGGRDEAKSLENLRRHGIKYVVNCTPPKTDGGILNYFEQKNYAIRYLRLPMQDNATEDLRRHFPVFFPFVEACRIRSDGNLLVHCVLGQSRSVAMAVSYLLVYLRYDSVERSIADIRKCGRPEADPNQAFRKQLEGVCAELAGGKGELKYDEDALGEIRAAAEKRRSGAPANMLKRKECGAAAAAGAAPPLAANEVEPDAKRHRRSSGAGAAEDHLLATSHLAARPPPKIGPALPPRPSGAGGAAPGPATIIGPALPSASGPPLPAAAIGPALPPNRATTPATTGPESPRSRATALIGPAGPPPPSTTTLE